MGRRRRMRRRRRRAPGRGAAAAACTAPAAARAGGASARAPRGASRSLRGILAAAAAAVEPVRPAPGCISTTAAAGAGGRQTLGVRPGCRWRSASSPLRFELPPADLPAPAAIAAAAGGASKLQVSACSCPCPGRDWDGGGRVALCRCRGGPARTRSDFRGREPVGPVLVSSIPRQSSGWLTDGFVEAAPLLASADSPRFPPSGEPRAGPAALRRSRGRRTGAGHRALESQVHPPGSFPTQLDSDSRAAGAQVHVLMYRGGLRGKFMCDGGRGVVHCRNGSGWCGCVAGGGAVNVAGATLLLQWPCGGSEKLLQGIPPS
jgi:hypothetical protein